MQNAGEIAKLHEPVLTREVLEAFGLLKAPLNKDVRIIDATLGLAGHTEALVKAGAFVLGIDADEETRKLAEIRLLAACPTPNSDWRYKLIHANFKDIDVFALKEGFTDVDGVLFDLGISSYQLTSRDRGFSFLQDDALLDMRIDRRNNLVSASDLLNLLREDQLFDMFFGVLDFSQAKKLAKEIVFVRSAKKINTIGDFRRVITKTIARKGKTDAATLPFMALRMAVNSELENLKEGMSGGLSILKDGGKLVIISFHSGEDKIVKNEFVRWEDLRLGKILTKKAIRPAKEEVLRNARSRSAKLRVFMKQK